LLNKKSKETVRNTHFYLLVNIKNDNDIEYYVVPSKIISRKMVIEKTDRGTWYAISRFDVEKYKDKWELLMSSE
jgi:hypothetical protein